MHKVPDPGENKSITMDVAPSDSEQPAPRPARQQSTKSTANTQTSPVTHFVPPELLIGRKVHHKTYGDGLVEEVSSDNEQIRVAFEDSEKTFVIAERSKDNAFKNGFLTLKD